MRQDAVNQMNVIMADYQPSALKIMGQTLTGLFKRIYDKIVVNER